jgi:hypothetical protein
METWELQYLQDTPWGIWNTPWTNSSIVWEAIDTNLLILKNQARKAKWTSGWAVTVVVWFYPVVVITSVVGGWNVYLDEQHISNKTDIWFDISWAYDRVAIW